MNCNPSEERVVLIEERITYPWEERITFPWERIGPDGTIHYNDLRFWKSLSPLSAHFHSVSVIEIKSDNFVFKKSHEYM